MIWICLKDLKYPEGWVERRDEVFQRLKDCLTSNQRSDLLDGAAASIWRGEMAIALAELSSSKCWYCETPITRDDLSVDHFRPKGRVFEDPDHPGYWWLAVEESNFRLACRFCNQRRVDKEGGTEGGKRTHFPLVEGSPRAYDEFDDWEEEVPELLDPVNVLDPPLLKFLIDGRVVPAVEEADYGIDWRRADRSIGVYHLLHGRLVIPRGQIASQVAEALRRADAEFRKYIRQRREGASLAEMRRAESRYQAAANRLAMYVQRSSPYAGVARSIVRQHRNANREYLDVILQGV